MDSLLQEAFQKSLVCFTLLGPVYHRVAISNQRIVGLDYDQVSFQWRDYKDDNRTKLMALEASEFIRRFLMHVLPSQFVKIRHYGILSNRNRNCKLRLCQKLTFSKILESQKLSAVELLLKLAGLDIRICPCCGGTMIRKSNFGFKFST